MEDTLVVVIGGLILAAITVALRAAKDNRHRIRDAASALRYWWWGRKTITASCGHESRRRDITEVHTHTMGAPPAKSWWAAKCAKCARGCTDTRDLRPEWW